MGFVGRSVLQTSTTDANYGGQSHWVGTRFTASAGTTTEHLFLVSKDVKLFTGSYWASGSAQNSDVIELSIVDQDGVQGESGVVLRQFVSSLYVVPQERRTLQSGQTSDVFAGTYLKVAYTSTGTDPVDVLVDWQWFQ